jgi:hypothetical protein
MKTISKPRPKRKPTNIYEDKYLYTTVSLCVMVTTILLAMIVAWVLTAVRPG